MAVYCAVLDRFTLMAPAHTYRNDTFIALHRRLTMLCLDMMIAISIGVLIDSETLELAKRDCYTKRLKPEIPCCSS
jgi:hypothetical protein